MDHIMNMNLHCDDIIAMESIGKDLTTYGERYNEALQGAYADYHKAIAKDDFEAAEKALTDIEVVARKWKNDLESIPKEGALKSNIKTIAYITATILCCIAMFKPNLIGGHIARILTRLKMSPTAIKAIVSGATTVGFSAGYIGLIVIITNECMKLAIGAYSPKILLENRGDPNARNAIYRVALHNMNETLKEVDGLRASLEKAKKEAALSKVTTN